MGALDRLYDEDFFAWAEQQARALREVGRGPGSNLPLDWENLAEEIEGFGKSQARELSKRYYRLLTLLLKWEFQPEKRKGGWRATVIKQRDGLHDVLEDNPGLVPQRQRRFQRAYATARQVASAETGHPPEAFPESCPYTLD